MVDHDIAATGHDTRALTKRLRNYGTMNGMITTNENFVLEEVLPKIKAYKVTDVVKRVSCKEKTVLPGDGMKVALMDFGAKKNIAKSLNERGCEVRIYPGVYICRRDYCFQSGRYYAVKRPRRPKGLRTDH